MSQYVQYETTTRSMASQAPHLRNATFNGDAFVGANAAAEVGSMMFAYEDGSPNQEEICSEKSNG